MKRVLCLLLCFCLLLCGCKNHNSRLPEEILREAEFITATNGKQLFTLELMESGGIFRFSSPEILQKLTVHYDGKEFTATYDGLETEVNELFLGEVFPLYEAVRAFFAEGAQWEEKNIRRIALDGKTFLLYYDLEGGLITRLEAKGADSVHTFEILSCIEKNDDAESSRTN